MSALTEDAEQILTKLLGEATVEGQMYALTELKAVDHAGFKAHLKSYTGNTNVSGTCSTGGQRLFGVAEEVSEVSRDVRADML